MKPTQKSLETAIIQWIGGETETSEIVKMLELETREQELKLTDILAETCRDWDNAPCDSQGATPEQDKNLDAIIETAANEILKLKI